MSKIENVEVQSWSEWVSASYLDSEGREYELVFTRSYDENGGFEQCELVNIEKDGKMIDSDKDIWHEIQKQLENLDWEGCSEFRSVRFTIEVDRDWLETLDSLVEMVMSNPGLSSEGSLEVSIFSQFKTQRNKREICHA